MSFLFNAFFCLQYFLRRTSFSMTFWVQNQCIHKSLRSKIKFKENVQQHMFCVCVKKYTLYCVRIVGTRSMSEKPEQLLSLHILFHFHLNRLLEVIMICRRNLWIIHMQISKKLLASSLKLSCIYSTSYT